MKIIIIIVLFVVLWQVFNLLYIVMKRQILYFSGTVVKRNDDILQQCSSLIVKQTTVLKTLVQKSFFWYIQKKANESQQMRKETVLAAVVNHINQCLTSDIGLNMVNPATTGGVDIWVYLAKKLDEQTQRELEDYFIGVLSKYTTEFTLDYMSIEMNGGVGWVAKFDIKTISEATYNRMARASEVDTKEDFEDVDLW